MSANNENEHEEDLELHVQFLRDMEAFYGSGGAYVENEPEEENLELHSQFLRDMETFYGPGGTYEMKMARRERREQNPRNLPALETYERVNSHCAIWAIL